MVEAREFSPQLDFESFEQGLQNETSKLFTFQTLDDGHNNIYVKVFFRGQENYPSLELTQKIQAAAEGNNCFIWNPTLQKFMPPEQFTLTAEELITQNTERQKRQEQTQKVLRKISPDGTNPYVK